MADNHIWERQPTDTDKSFEAFSIYRDMGANRSLDIVSQKLSKSIPLIKRWSRQHNWQERVAHFDNAQSNAAIEDNAERQKLIKDNAFDDYLLLRKAIKKYKSDYEAIEFRGVPSYEISNLVELMKKADDYARRSVGLPDKITEQKNDTTIKGNLSLTWEKLMQGEPDNDSDPFA
jgi:hypothetical protein